MINQVESMQVQQPNYGKIKPLCGPYYKSPQPNMVIFTGILSMVIIILLLTTVFINGWHRYIGGILCLYFYYRFISLSFSNPGLSFQSNMLNTTNNNLYCQVCNISVRQQSHHCSICDVCIDGFDHHCIFIGKCIGRNNLGQFKDFLLIIFGTLIYGMIMSMQMSGILSSH